MKSLFFTSLFSFLFSWNLVAQLDTVDIGRFILPNYEFQSLLLKLDFLGSTSKSRGGFSTGQNNEINFDSRIEYYKAKNNRKYQGFISTTADLDFSFLSSISNNNTTPYASQSGLIRLFGVSQNRYFYKPKNFFEINYSAGTGYRRDDLSPHPSSNKIGEKSFFGQLALEIMIGQGRLENVTSAWRAVRILREFEKSGILKDLPKDDQILQLANLLTILQNRRIFDSRLRRIESLEQLDHFFQREGLLQNDGMAYFSILYDTWNFGVNASRSAGGTFSFGFIPSIDYGFEKMLFNSNGNPSDEVETSLIAGFFGKMKWIYCKPINQAWQINVGIDLIAGMTYVETEEVTHKTAEKSLRVSPSLFVSAGFYPSSRSTLRSSLRSSFEAESEYSDIDFGTAPFVIDWDTSFYYYFSPRLRWLFGINFSNTAFLKFPYLQGDSETNNWKASINVGVDYFLF